MNPQEMEMAVLKLSRQHQQYGSSQSKEKNCAIPSLKKEYHEKQKGKFSLHLKEKTLTLSSKNIALVKS